MDKITAIAKLQKGMPETSLLDLKNIIDTYGVPVEAPYRKENHLYVGKHGHEVWNCFVRKFFHNLLTGNYICEVYCQGLDTNGYEDLMLDEVYRDLYSSGKHTFAAITVDGKRFTLYKNDFNYTLEKLAQLLQGSGTDTESLSGGGQGGT